MFIAFGSFVILNIMCHLVMFIFIFHFPFSFLRVHLCVCMLVCVPSVALSVSVSAIDNIFFYGGGRELPGNTSKYSIWMKELVISYQLTLASLLSKLGN